MHLTLFGLTFPFGNLIKIMDFLQRKECTDTNILNFYNLVDVSQSPGAQPKIKGLCLSKSGVMHSWVWWVSAGTHSWISILRAFLKILLLFYLKGGMRLGKAVVPFLHFLWQWKLCFHVYLIQFFCPSALSEHVFVSECVYVCVCSGSCAHE